MEKDGLKAMNSFCIFTSKPFVPNFAQIVYSVTMIDESRILTV